MFISLAFMRKNKINFVSTWLALVGVVIILSNILFQNSAVADDTDVDVSGKARLCIDQMHTKNLGVCMEKVKAVCVTQFRYSQCNFQIAERTQDYYLEKIAGDEISIEAYKDVSFLIGDRCGELAKAETDRTASEAVISQCAYKAVIYGILAINPFAYVYE